MSSRIGVPRNAHLHVLRGLHGAAHRPASRLARRHSARRSRGYAGGSRGEGRGRRGEEEGRSPWVITISREYGSGGHTIGKILADQLGVPLYDRQLIDKTAHNLGIDQNVVAKSDQNISNSQLWEAIFTDHSIPESMNPSQDDVIFVAQSRIIRRLADKKACIIIGLLANWVLRDDKHALKVFVCADANLILKAVKDFESRAQ